MIFVTMPPAFRPAILADSSAIFKIFEISIKDLSQRLGVMAISERLIDN